MTRRVLIAGCGYVGSALALRLLEDGGGPPSRSRVLLELHRPGGRAGQRCSCRRRVESGNVFRHPTFREGYARLLPHRAVAPGDFAPGAGT